MCITKVTNRVRNIIYFRPIPLFFFAFFCFFSFFLFSAFFCIFFVFFLFLPVELSAGVLQFCCFSLILFFFLFSKLFGFCLRFRLGLFHVGFVCKWMLVSWAFRKCCFCWMVQAPQFETTFSLKVQSGWSSSCTKRVKFRWFEANWSNHSFLKSSEVRQCQWKGNGNLRQVSVERSARFRLV